MSDLEARISDSKRRLLDAAEEICVLLQSDIRGYPDRELERRFMTRPDAAAALAEETLAMLRGRAAALGDTLAGGIAERLGEPERWLGLASVDGLPPEGKDLREVAPIWAVIAELVDPAVETLASEHGLGGDEREPPGYPAPRRFIDRRYLPALTEAVLREVVVLRRLQDERGAVVAAQATQSLAERWAAASPKNGNG